jgi:hypothetical protein
MLKKISFLVLLLIGITFTKCDHNLVAPVVAVIDEPFWIEFAERKVVLPDKLVVDFRQVITDSRCPKDARCFVAGQAEIMLFLAKPRLESTNISIKIFDYVTKENIQSHQSTDKFGYKITLLQLDPYPQFNKRPKPSDYKALLKISKLL